MSSNLIQQIEFLLGSVGVILAIFFAVALLISLSRQPKANLFLIIYLIAFALRIGKSLFHQDFEIPEVVRTYLIATLYVIGPSLWLYTRNLKNPNEQIRTKDWFHFIPFIICCFIGWAIPNYGTSSFFTWFYNGTILSMFAYAIYALYWVTQINGRRFDEERMDFWLRYFLIANIALVVFYFLASIVFSQWYGGVSIGFSLLIVVSAIVAMRIPQLWKKQKERYSKSNTDEQKIISLSSTLETIIKNDRPYLDLEMNLNKLSTLVGCSSKELSQVINQNFQMNYAQYIAEHRLKESMERLTSAEYDHISIAGIAYDSGFNSISSFNSQFKKYVGMTASQYRKQKGS